MNWKKQHRLIFFLILLIYLITGCSNVKEEPIKQRLALLIGNQGYQKSRLNTPHNDVDDMEESLKSVGFQVQKLKDQSLEEMERAIVDFSHLLKQNKNMVGLFYFSGHAMQYQGQNFLLPIGAMSLITTPQQLQDKTLKVKDLLYLIKGVGNQANLLFLDACCDHSFAKEWFTTRKVEQGLAPMQAPNGSLIAYTSCTNHPALATNNGQRNSPYTRHLTQEILKPGVSISDILTNVRVAVKKETYDTQAPDFHSGLNSQFCFKGPCEQVAQLPTPVVTIEENTMANQPTHSVDLTHKIGQMLLVGFRGVSPEDQGVQQILADIKQFNLGGVILFSYDAALKSPKRNILSKQQVQQLITTLNSAVPSELPLLVAVDQEGGKVQRLKSAGLPNTLSAKTLGRGNPVKTHEHAYEMAQAMANMGFNLNFAPVVDLDNPNNPIIGRLERSFSDNPQRVTEHASAFIWAHHENEMLCAIKHFPGHGSATQDSHLGLVDVTHSWEDRELEPYRNLLEKDLVDAIMTAHIFHQQWRYPATLSYEVITEILRDELGYQGVVFSDDMQMKAISQHYGYENAVKMALDAGIDILVIGNNLTYHPDVVWQTVGIIQKLIQEGQVTEYRINQSFERIQRLKSKIP